MVTRKRPIARQFLSIILALLVITSVLQPLPAKAAAQTTGDRFYAETYSSATLNKELGYRIYLPEGYERSDQRFPVVYLLHDEGGSSLQFEEDGLAGRLDQWIADGEIQKMIVVMPDTGSDSWFINQPGAPWEDVIVSDLIPSIDANYRTIASPQYRGISGISMGGYGAFMLGLKHPDLFRSIASHMGALGTTLQGQNPLTLLQSMSVGQLGAYNYYLDGGTEDSLTYADGSTNDIHAYFRGKNIRHEYQMRPGGHTRDYYLTYLDRSFAMHSNSFGSSLVTGSFTAAPQAISDQTEVQVDYTINLNRSLVTEYVYGNVASSDFHLLTRLKVTTSEGEDRFSDQSDLGDVVTSSNQNTFTGTFTIPVSALGTDKSFKVSLEGHLLGSSYSFGTKPLIQVTPIGSAPEDTQIDLLGDWYFTKDTFPDSTVEGLKPDLQQGDWRIVQPGLDWWTNGFGNYSDMGSYYGAAWYYREFWVPEDFPDEDLTLLAGKIDDADQTYINGQLIAETGFKNGGYTSSFWAQSREYSIPSGLLKRGEVNRISIRIYNQNGGGGWYAGPVGIYTKAALQKEKKLPSKVPAESLSTEVKALAEKQLSAIASKNFAAYRDTLAPGYFEKGYGKLQKADQAVKLVNSYSSIKTVITSPYVFELDGKYLYTAYIRMTGKDTAGQDVVIQEGQVSQYYQYTGGKLLESGDQKRFYVTEFFSKSANRMVKYRVYLPPGYLTDQSKRYPSVYLLHQFNSDSESYEIDKVDQILDNGIADGSLRDMIVVIPDSSGMSWWVNGEGADGVKWQDMVTKDLVSLIDDQYRTIDDARYRATSGVSMGGFGAFAIGLQYPNLFSSVASHMGALPFTMSGQNPVKIVTQYPIDALKRYSLYIDFGNLDGYKFDLAVNTLHKYLMNAGIPHYAEIRDGAHDSAFYTKSIGLSFAMHSRHFAPANVDSSVLSGTTSFSRSADGTDQITYAMSAKEGISAYTDVIPVSPYVKETNPALVLPVTVEVFNTTVSESVYRWQDTVSVKGAADFSQKIVLPESLADGNYEIVLTSAVLDHSLELSRVPLKISSNSGSGSKDDGNVTVTPVVSGSDTSGSAVTVTLDEVKKAIAAKISLQFSVKDGSKLEVPFETLQQWVNAVGADQLQAIKWSIAPIPASEQATWIHAAASSWTGQLAPAGPVVDMNIKALLKDGTAQVLSAPFVQPVGLSLTASTQADRELMGIYHLTADQKLEYLGGTFDTATGTMTAKLNHFSKYGVWTYTKSYQDLVQSHWAHRAVQVLSAGHIVNGVTDTAFAPDRQVTRAEFAAMLVRSLRLQADNTVLPFKDVPANSWFYPSVAAAYQVGIIRGISQDEFAPEKTITREEMAVMIYNAYRLKSSDAPVSLGQTAVFSDRSQIHDWAQTSLNAVLNLGLMKGTSSTTLEPLSQATRAQSAEILYRFIK
ncbi:alpha/beta hydrolase-fold protein [Paenibacillus sp. sgz5001063]|uniref:alpha/beta hydrolase-fold protein n=1 Tax=Paenibacillus sp. sgz5001063 TaxID=3242474 RepID=UPI0036D2446A